MDLRMYVALLDREPGESAWSILVPDFPEVASGAADGDDLAREAFDAVATAVAARLEDGEALPAPTPLEHLTMTWRARPLIVPVDVASPWRTAA